MPEHGSGPRVSCRSVILLCRAPLRLPYESAEYRRLQVQDETNVFLRQILETQEEHLAAYKDEVRRVEEFRHSVMETQTRA